MPTRVLESAAGHTLVALDPAAAESMPDSRLQNVTVAPGNSDKLTRVIESASGETLVSLGYDAPCRRRRWPSDSIESPNVSAIMAPLHHPVVDHKDRPLLKPVPSARDGIMATNAVGAVPLGQEDSLMQSKHRANGPREAGPEFKVLGSGKARVDGVQAAGSAVPSTGEAGAIFDAPSARLMDAKGGVRMADSLRDDLQGDATKASRVAVEVPRPPVHPMAHPAAAGNMPPADEPLFTRKRMGAFRPTSSLTQLS